MFVRDAAVSGTPVRILAAFYAAPISTIEGICYKPGAWKHLEN